MENGVWRTISGRRVFIKEGQSLREAMRDSKKFQDDKKIEEEEMSLDYAEEMKKNKQFIQDISKIMTKEEVEVIDNYSAFYHNAINGYLRGDDDGDDTVKEEIKKMDSALSKLPNYKNNDGAVNRLLNVNNDVWDKIESQYGEGEIVQFNEYLSTTAYMSNAKLNENRDGYRGWKLNEEHTEITYRVIKSKNGKDLTKMYESEKEVIFPRGSRFKVLEKTEKKKNKNGHWGVEIYMIEVVD